MRKLKNTNNITIMKIFKFAFIFILTSVLFTCFLVEAQQQNNDYFAKDRDNKLLSVVERYHLATESFWNQFMEGNYKSANSENEYILRYFPNHPTALSLHGRVTALMKTPELTLSYYFKALKLFPQHAYTHAQCGNYLVENSESKSLIEEGIGKIKKAVEINPNLAVAYAWLAKAYIKYGDSGLALKAAEQAKQLGYEDEILDKILNDGNQK